MEERLDLVIAERRKTGGLSLGFLISFLLHGLLVWWLVRAYQPVNPAATNVPIARYVELIKQNPGGFVEAPGPKLEKAPSLTAPLSDGNRKASMPEPTGLTPTRRPGDGSGLYRPPMGEPAPRAAQPPSRPSPQQAPRPAQQGVASSLPQSTSPSGLTADPGALTYREATRASAAQGMPAPSIDWKSAIREVARTTVGSEGFDVGAAGGEQGTAEQGPLSFETQWYDWGDYAQSMVSRIRVNWYANMPQLFRTGLAGVVTIRFTIHRDGRISDVTILESSGHPPYDQAAKKAIEQSSPLRALPQDFPNPYERVTAMFYYNKPIPRG